MALLWFKHLQKITESRAALIRAGESAFDNHQELHSQGPSSLANTANTPNSGSRMQRLIRKHNQQSNSTSPSTLINQKEQSSYTKQNYENANKYPDSPALSHEELHDLGAPNTALSRTTTLFPLSSGGRSSGDYRTQQSIPLRKMSRDQTYKSDAQPSYEGQSSNSYQDTTYGRSTYRRNEYYQDNATPVDPFGTTRSDMRGEAEENSTTVGSSSRNRNFSYTSSPRPLRDQQIHSSSGRYGGTQPGYGESGTQNPPRSGGGESSLSFLRPDPLYIHKARSSPLPSVLPTDGLTRDMARPEATRQGSLGNANYDDTGQSSSDYRSPRQYWQSQAEEYSKESDPNWKRKGLMSKGEDEMQTLGGSTRFQMDRSRTHPFGRQRSRSDLYPSDSGTTQAGNTMAEERSVEHYPIASNQAPVAYGLPPLGRDNATTQTESPNIMERKLNVLDLVSRLRNRHLD